MLRVVTEMAQSTHVDKPEVDAVMASMTTLFQGVTAIAARCQQAASTGQPPPNELPPVPPANPMDD
eukprot:6133250-Heterocapsa_arctica.AAC.1